MSLTLLEVLEKLKELDEVTLLEVLDIKSEDIVCRFIDEIEDKYEELAIDLEADEELDE